MEITSDSLIYSANRIPEISDDLVNIDNAMKWGFAWEAGPFEGWDALGVRRTTKRMIASKKVPKWVLEMTESGRETFYSVEEMGKGPIGAPVANIRSNRTKSKRFNLLLHKTAGHTIKEES